MLYKIYLYKKKSNESKIIYNKLNKMKQHKVK